MVEKVSYIYLSAFNHVSGRPQRNYWFCFLAFYASLIYLEGLSFIYLFIHYCYYIGLVYSISRVTKVNYQKRLVYWCEC